jgi:hypothetical protein
LYSDLTSKVFIALTIFAFIFSDTLSPKNAYYITSGVKYHKLRHILFNVHFEICISMTSYNISSLINCKFMFGARVAAGAQYNFKFQVYDVYMINIVYHILAVALIIYKCLLVNP